MRCVSASSRFAGDTNEQDVRIALRAFAKNEHSSEADTLFLEEFALYGGEIRADLAALNGVSHGYEIKSGRDTLQRLPRQVIAYGDVFEYATLVAPQCHLTDARCLIPTWWGIVKVEGDQSGILLRRLRQARPNPAPKSAAIAALLWRAEALSLLSLLGMDAGMKSKPMSELIDKLARELPPDHLGRLVRQALRARGDWQSAARDKRCDEKYQHRANLWGSRRRLSWNKPQ